MRVKICGITKADQGIAIAQMGATALGFICVPTSPRYVSASQINQIVKQLEQQFDDFRFSILDFGLEEDRTNPKSKIPNPKSIDLIGVFANEGIEAIAQTVAIAGLNGVQLHGDESVEFCVKLRQILPNIEIIKAFRVRNLEALNQAEIYLNSVDTLLLDAYHPQMLGGTGKTLDWKILEHFHPNCPWFLAGGLTPENVLDALSQIQPGGIDLSSGVERAPGDKDLEKVAKLLMKLRGVGVGYSEQ